MQDVISLLLTLAYILGCASLFVQCANDCANLPTRLTEADITVAIFDPVRFKHWERPVLNANESLGVTLQLVIRNVIEVNERLQHVKLNGYMRVLWYDQLHVWNETFPLNCQKHVVVPYGKRTGVWIPDVSFTTSTSLYDLTRGTVQTVRIRSDGYVSLYPGIVFDLHCEFNLAFFPFDIQTCKLTFESWMLQINYQHFEIPKIDVDPLHGKTNPEWELVGKGKAERKFGNTSSGQWDWVDFEIQLRRKPGYYALTIILPCLLIAAVEVVTFTIPLRKAVRLEVSFTSLLAYSMFQSIISDQMPHSAQNPPLLLVLISVFTIYIAFAIYLQGITLHLAEKGFHGDEIPYRLLRVIDFLAPVTGLTRLRTRLARLGKPSGNFETATNEEAWLFIARVINRFGAISFILLLLATSFALLVAIPASEQLL